MLQLGETKILRTIVLNDDGDDHTILGLQLSAYWIWYKATNTGWDAMTKDKHGDLEDRCEAFIAALPQEKLK